MSKFLKATVPGGEPIGLRADQIDVVGIGRQIVGEPSEPGGEPETVTVTLLTLRSGLQVPVDASYDEIMALLDGAPRR